MLAAAMAPSSVCAAVGVPRLPQSLLLSRGQQCRPDWGHPKWRCRPALLAKMADTVALCCPAEVLKLVQTRRNRSRSSQECRSPTPRERKDCNDTSCGRRAWRLCFVRLVHCNPVRYCGRHSQSHFPIVAIFLRALALSIARRPTDPHNSNACMDGGGTGDANLPRFSRLDWPAG